MRLTPAQRDASPLRAVVLWQSFVDLSRSCPGTVSSTCLISFAAVSGSSLDPGIRGVPSVLGSSHPGAHIGACGSSQAPPGQPPSSHCLGGTKVLPELQRVHFEHPELSFGALWVGRDGLGGLGAGGEDGRVGFGEVVAGRKHVAALRGPIFKVDQSSQ